MELTIEYIAGFFDGEGCICITKDRKFNNRMKNGYSLNPYIILTQKKPNILIEIQRFLLEKEIESDLLPMKNGSICRLRIIGTKKILAFCNLMLPYLICKKEELKTMKEAMEYRLAKTGNKEYTSKDLEFYELLHAQKNSDFVMI